MATRSPLPSPRRSGCGKAFFTLLILSLILAVLAWKLNFLPAAWLEKLPGIGAMPGSEPASSPAPAKARVKAGPVLEPLRWVESPLASVPAKVVANAVWADRVVYEPNDPSGQILVVSQAFSKAPAGSRLEVSVVDGNGKTWGAQEFVSEEGKLAYLIAAKLNVSQLPAGTYTLSAQFTPPDGSAPTALTSGSFAIGHEVRPLASFPADGVALVVPPVPAKGMTVAPVSFGVPLPYGAIQSGEKLEVWEDGQPILTQSQPMAQWGPDAEDSVRWMAISFLARYRDGQAHNYRLKKAGAPLASPLTVTDTAESVQVNTGAVRFQISKKAFRGAEQVAVKPGSDWTPLAANAPGGAYVVDEAGTRYEAAADPNPEITLEESGPVRAAISIKGWYVNPANPADKLCQFRVRLYAYAGLARIDGFQRTIVTYDTHLKKLADVGFSLPAIPGASGVPQWMTGIDGEIQKGGATEAGEIFFAQAGANSVWLNRIEGEPAGRRSDGWLSLSGGGVTASGFLSDVWEKFPKEISATGEALTFHTWPRHGRRIVAPEEEITLGNIHRNLFAHQGPLMDLQLPEAYFNQLRQWNEEKFWDRENTAFIGYRSGAVGVSLSIRFGVEYFPATTAPEAVAAQSVVNQLKPSASTNPQWNAATGVIPFITAAGDPRWKKADELLETFATGMSNLAAAGQIYGMWIYGNTNNNWDTALKSPMLHRVWQNSHYGHASFPWKYYFRSGDPRFLKMARAQTGNLMDVGIVHYSAPEEAGKYAGKGLGALYHAKGWLPWGVRLRGEFPTDSDLGTLQHWTNPKVFLERYLAEVDLEAKDVFDLWFHRLVTQYQYRSRYGVGRELTQSISELTDIYQNRWDPRLVGYLRPMGDSALNTAFRSYPSQLGFAFFNRTWPIRYYEFARDPKVIERLEEALPTENYGPYGMASAAFLLSQKKEMKRAPRLLNVIDNADRGAFRQPGDPLDGFGSYSSAVDSRSLDEIPAVESALATLSAGELAKVRNAGIPVDPVFPARAGRILVRDGAEAALILALNPDGRPFKVRLESRMGIDMLPGVLRVVGPDGKEIQRIPLHDKNPDGSSRALRYLGEKAPVFEFAGGQPGIYRMEFFGYYPIYRAPLTDLPNEVAVLGQGSQAVNGFIFAPGAETLTLKFAVGKPAGAARPQSFFVRNLEDAKTFETVLLYGSTRMTDSVTLTGGKEGVRAEVRAPFLHWDPVGQTIFFAHRWESFAPVLAQLGSQSTALDNSAAPAATGSEPADDN